MKTPPTSIVLFGNGLSTAFTSAPQIQPVSPLSAISNPIVTITITISGRPSTGRMSVALDGHAAAERDQQGQGERRPVRKAVVHQRPGDESRERRHLALREVDDVRRSVDEHEREREAPVDRARREAARDLLQSSPTM